MFNKVLLGVIAALLLVAVSGLSYFFGRQSSVSPLTAEDSESEAVQRSNQPDIGNELRREIQQSDDRQTIVNANYLRTFLRYKKGGVLSILHATVELKGEINTLYTTSGSSSNESGPFSYQLGIAIKGGNDSEPTAIFYNSQDLPKIKVYDSSGGSRSPISFQDLKVGDKVTVKHVIDLTKGPESNTLDVEITKI